MLLHRKVSLFTVLILLALLPSAVLSKGGSPKPAPKPTGTLKQQIDALCEPTEGQLRQQISKNPKDVGARMKYAACLAADKKNKEAIVEYNKILAIDPKHIPALLARSICYEHIHNLQGAFADCKSAAEIDTSNADALKAYVLIADKCGKLPQATPQLRILARVDAHKAASCYWAIAQRVVEKDYYGAQSYAKSAHTLYPAAYPNEIHPKPIRAIGR